MNKLAKLVIKDRLNLAMTQTEYSLMLGISITSVVNIEKGEMLGSKVIKALSKHFEKNTKEIRKMMLSKTKGD